MFMTFKIVLASQQVQPENSPQKCALPMQALLSVAD
jgi:hypothetical protein